MISISERHIMGPLEISPPKRPENWDAYLFQAWSHCIRCRNMLTMELWIPGRLLDLIPEKSRDGALRIMSDFLRKRAEYNISLVVNSDYPEFPPCKGDS